MNKARFVILAITLLAILAANEAYAYPFKPQEDFKTFNTAHFRITYPAEHRFVALQAAIIAEEYWGTLVARLKYKPHTPIDIILTDRTDSSNGSSMTTPMQVIRLFLAPPHSSDRLDYNDTYLRLLLIHEMTHAVHTDEVRGVNRLIRWTFGRILPLGFLQPLGLIEGITVYHESVLTSMGRTHSPTTRMYLRMAALENRWPTLDQLTVFPNGWPGSAVPYLWGGMFTQHLADRYGMDKLADYYLKHAGQVYPFLFNHNARVVFGTHLQDLYDAWSVNLKQGFEAERERVAADGLTVATRLTASGFIHDSPHWLDSWTLVFAERNDSRPARLLRLDIRKPTARRLAVTYTTRGLTIADDGSVIYADTHPSDRWRSYFDLWRKEPGRLTPRRLTTNARLSDPAAVPGTDRVVAIRQSSGLTQLVLFDTRTGAISELTGLDQFGGLAQFAGPAVHPSGRWAAVSVWHEDGNRDIFKIDLETGRFTRLTSHPTRDIDPAFDPSGRYLLFASERTGIANLFALDLATDELRQVTNVLGGAGMPAIDPTGARLAYVDYSAAGFDLYWLPFDPAAWRPVPRETIARNEIVPGAVGRSILERAALLDPATADYQPAQTVWPHYWFPTYALQENDFWLGAQTLGYDIAGRHSWALTAMWGFQREFPHVAAAYSYLRFTPAFQLSASHTAHEYGKIVLDDRGKPDNYWERRVSSQAQVSYPLGWRHNLYAAYVAEWRTDLDELPDESPEPSFTGLWSGARAGWNIDMDAEYQQYFLFPSGLGVTLYEPALGSDVSQQIFGAQLGLWTPLPIRDAGFLLLGRGGISYGEQLPQRTFRLGGVVQQNTLNLGYDRDRFALRGYQTGVVRGDVAAAGDFEAHFPLVRIERGFSTWPVYLRDLTAATFAEGGFAADRRDLEGLTKDDFYPSTGVELNLNATVTYNFTARLHTMAAYGFRDDQDKGGYQWLVNLEGLLP